MEKLVKHIIESIVNHPKAVKVTAKESIDFPGSVIIHITADPEDLGIVIGKRGRTINSIRDLVTIAAIRQKKRVKIVVDEDEDKQTNHNSDTSTASDKQPEVTKVAQDKNNKTEKKKVKEEEPKEDTLESVAELDKELGL